MKQKIIILLTLLLICSYPALAAEEIFEVPDGPTAPTSATAPSPSAASATSVTSPTTTSTGEATYSPVANTPPCGNSTCINSQTIFNAKHGYVGDSPVKSYVTLLQPPVDGNTCQTPTMTGIEMNRQTAEGLKGKIVKYDDGFCINQGCVYFNDNGDKRCE